MKQSSQLQTVVELLREVTALKTPLDGFLDTYYRNRRFIGSKDRRTITTTLYEMIRCRALIDYVLLEFCTLTALNDRLRLIAFLVLIKKLPEQAILELFEGHTYGLPPLSAEEILHLGALQKTQNVAIHAPEAVQVNVPTWLFNQDLYSHIFRPALFDELEALNKAAPTDIRVNPRKTSRNALKNMLTEHDIRSEPTPHAPHALRVEGRPALKALNLFKEGYFEFQDEGSQLITSLVAFKEPRTILDLCAGAGGKTVHLGCLLNEKSQITATDIQPKRLLEAKKRAQKAGLKNITFIDYPEHNPAILLEAHPQFECVLVDAPCTGSGTWRRKPELKWRLQREDIASMARLQEKILARASLLVCPGGNLIYVTCSIFYEENESIVENFLANHAHYEMTPIQERLTSLPEAEEGMSSPYLFLSPHKTKTDGFFAARLRRKY